MTAERTTFDRLLAAQKEIEVITKDKTNPYFNHKYADINTILKMVKPILNNEELLLLQPLSNVNGKPAIKTIIVHGEDMISETMVMPEDTNPQKMGSTITYYRRYAIVSILCLESEDDDGNAASQPSAPKKEQPKAQQPPQTDNIAVGIPTCSICHKPMEKQNNNPGKYFCKHTEKGQVQWGKEVYGDQKKVT